MSKKEKVLAVLKSSTFWGVVLFVLLLAIDQITKVAADAYFSSPDAPDQVPVIPGLINLTMSYNRGIAFGVAHDASPALKLAIIIGTAVLMVGIAVLFFFVDKRRTVVRVALVMIFSGGVGNLIDRLYYQVWNPATATGFQDGVRDMVDLSAFGLAVCNFADFFIVIGAIVLIVAFLFFDRDAFFPMGKFKALAEEHEAKEKAKKEQKDGAQMEQDAKTSVEQEAAEPPSLPEEEEV